MIVYLLISCLILKKDLRQLTKTYLVQKVKMEKLIGREDKIQASEIWGKIDTPSKYMLKGSRYFAVSMLQI